MQVCVFMAGLVVHCRCGLLTKVQWQQLMCAVAAPASSHLDVGLAAPVVVLQVTLKDVVKEIDFTLTATTLFDELKAALDEKAGEKVAKMDRSFM